MADQDRVLERTVSRQAVIEGGDRDGELLEFDHDHPLPFLYTDRDALGYEREYELQDSADDESVPSYRLRR